MRAKSKEQLPKLAGCWCSRPIAGSDIIYINWYESGVKQPRKRSAGTTDPDIAAAKLAKHVLEIKGPQAAKADATQIGPLLTWYLDNHIAKKCKHAVYLSTKSSVATLVDLIGDKTVEDLRNSKVISKLIDTMRDEHGYRGHTINRHITNLKGALNYAHENGTLTEPPPVIKALSKDTCDGDLQEAEIFSEPQLRELLEIARRGEFLKPARPDGYMFKYILIMLATGCRPEAAEELEVRQLDFEHDLIHLNQPGRHQNNKKRPTVKMVPSIKPYLKEWVKGRKPTDRVVHDDGHLIGGPRAGDLWRAIVHGKMNLVGRFIRYSLRHTVISTLVAAGVDAGQISMQVGHKRADVGQTTSRYIRDKFVHLSPEYLKATAEGIEKIVSAALKPPADKKVVAFKRA